MLSLFFSNRYEVLADALFDALPHAQSGFADPAEPLADPFVPVEIVVPSMAVRRRLELDIAGRFGICANVRFHYLADWLWQQIGRTMPVPERSPFSPDVLVWRCFRLLGAAPPSAARARDAAADTLRARSTRLDAYLGAADEAMRYELALRVASVFDHYLTYRPDWLAAWQAGRSIFGGANDAPHNGARGIGMPVLTGATDAQRDDEQWQAALWRLLLAESAPVNGAANGMAAPAAHRFLAEARTLDLDTVARARWPARVNLFVVPAIAPLHLALLGELAHWLDIAIYTLNPCREFWYDIVTESRSVDLELADRLDYHEVGNPLLAEWGRQTQAHLHALQELGDSGASVEQARYIDNPAPTWLAALQNAILDLRDLPDMPAWPGERRFDRLAVGEGDDGRDTSEGVNTVDWRDRAAIEIHVCHSLSRQIDVLHDRLLALFDATPGLEPADVLVAFADLAGAAPLIDAVFGTAAHARRIPYRITGLPASATNPVARVLLDLLGLPERRPGAPELIEWLRVDALAARYRIDAAALETIQGWLDVAGARAGFAPGDAGDGPIASTSASPSATASAAVVPRRHTFADALTRLYLGYAMPDDGEPIGDWLPVSGATGNQAMLLGRLSRFVDDVETLARSFAQPHTVDTWRALLADALERLFDASASNAGRRADDVADMRDALDAVLTALDEGAAQTPVAASVIRLALTKRLDDPARGGVPAGGVTFCALSSLRQLPYRVIWIAGMDDGALPSVARADEFDLLAAFGRQGDRTRRDDERNLFLDLVLAARDRLLISYTGRSIRDNAPLPPSTLVDELLDHLALALTRAEGGAAHMPSPDALHAARARFVVEHPLQPFAAAYLRAGAGEGAGASSAAAPALFTYDPDRAEIANALASVAVPRQPFFDAPLPPEAQRVILFEDFSRFWMHPARALLRDRLGIGLSDARLELSDVEPFELDWNARDAFSERLLPALLDDAGDGGGAGREFGANPAHQADLPPGTLERARRIAAASPEIPDGATGAVMREREFIALAKLARQVRRTLAGGAANLPFALDIAPCWPSALAAHEYPAADMDTGPDRSAAARLPLTLEGVLGKVTEHGLVIYRHARPNSRDYLRAWLAHLVLCALPASVLAGSARRTLWLGDGTSFAYREVDAAPQRLAAMLALYRAGRRMPLPFFPRSAFAHVSEGEAAALRCFEGTQQSVGESSDPYVRIAFAGREPVLDSRFTELAAEVFKPLIDHLDLDGAVANTGFASEGELS